MRKGEGNATVPLIETDDLKRKILVDGKTVTVSEASAEQFDTYVYSVLYQMYEKKGHAHNRYELSFYEYDFREPLPRQFALNKLRKLNQIRMGTPTFKPGVPLFVEEEQADVTL